MKQYFCKIIFFLMDFIRPMLGPNKVCIHPVSCSCYAKNIFEQKPLYQAIPLIILRLLSCNPITAIYWKLINKY